MAKPLEAGCFNYTNIKNLGRVNEFYNSDGTLNSFKECTDRLVNRLKDYFNELPKDKDLFILPVIRKTSKDESNISYSSYALTLPVKILNDSPMDYNRFANIIIAEIL